MDVRKFMIIAKGEIITKKVNTCVPVYSTHRYDITFENGSTYTYGMSNVLFMTDPKILKPDNYLIETPDGKLLFNIEWIYEFTGGGEKYWHLEFKGFQLDYKKSDLNVRQNCLLNPTTKTTFDYIKEVATLSEIKNENNERILGKYYEKIEFVSDSSALSRFLNSSGELKTERVKGCIFPFGCNQSQYKAVNEALKNQISVIQGPPGTGKTQTILNIIANVLVRGESVLIVSNNNSATLNVYEKLEKYGMGFLVATLGSVDNKSRFIANQSGKYPDLSDWELEFGNNVELYEINKIAEQLQSVYKLQEDIAKLNAKSYELEIESKHFFEYVDDTGADYGAIKVRGGVSSDKVMMLWQELQSIADLQKRLSLLVKLKSVLYYGIADWNFYKQDLSKIITVLQGMFYEQSLKEINRELEQKEKELNDIKSDYDKELERKSLKFFKAVIASRYNWRGSRTLFTEEDLYNSSSSVLANYPVVLSTTFSSRTSLNPKLVEYDYVIMDEASQVDLSTGALALSCAKHAVIVGDLKQLPNVVDDDAREKAGLIRAKYEVRDAYDFANKSFLESVVEAIPNVPQTLLREHYRCHPRIISFCNQKFYNDELVIMTRGEEADKPLMAIKTVEGNHKRGNYNQRQIDIIKDEILKDINYPLDEIGIIAPYNEQVNEIRKQIPGIDVATVHKFQGREKDVIILSTVDDQIRDFVDDPNLLNVAVSRAKKKLIVVVSGNKQDKEGNIVDLISYIQYNNMEVVNSQVFSIFDNLYSQYTIKRWEYLKKHRKVSQYDSENLTFALIKECLKEFPNYGVACFTPLSMVVKDVSSLDGNEVKYLMNPGTHLDFLIFNKMSKQPVLAIETDGYTYHKAGTKQAERDQRKNHIMESCGLPLLRLSTNGSQEKARIMQALQNR